MSNVIIQETEFKAGEYGELVVLGQPVLETVFFDLYPKGVYGEPREAQHKEKGPPFEPPVMTSMPVVETPSPNGGGWAPPVSATVPSPAVVPTPERGEEAEAEQVGLAESLAEPRMVLYCSNSPRDGWKRIGEFKAHLYSEQVRRSRFYRIIHPKDCPFEGKVVVTGKSI